MNCRPTALAAAVLAAIALAACPTPARADVMNPGFATYELTSDTAIPAANLDPLTHPVPGGPPIPQVVFSTIPLNGIAPPEVPPAKAGDAVTHGSPLTVLDTSSGIDQSNNGFVAVGLRPGTNPDGSANRLFGLSFFSKDLPVGLKSAADGGHLDFTLRVDKSLPAPTFTIDPSSIYKGLHLAQINLPAPPPPPPATPPPPPAPPVIPPTPPATPPPPPTSSTTSAGASVPEPMSLALWSALTGFGLLRVRAYRRKGL